MRRLFSILLVYVVLLAQGIAPVSASLAVARSLDPLSPAIICTEFADTSQGSKEHHGSTDDHCPQCSVAISNFVLSPSENAILLAPPNLATKAAWAIRIFLLAGTYDYGIAQARAPPLLMV
jgi:hypothetical protein